VPGLLGHVAVSRGTEAEELLTNPQQLSDWARQAGLVDAAIDVTEDDLGVLCAA